MDIRAAFCHRPKSSGESEGRQQAGGEERVVQDLRLVPSTEWPLRHPSKRCRLWGAEPRSALSPDVATYHLIEDRLVMLP